MPLIPDLAPYFSPAIGKELVLDGAEEQGRRYRHNPELLRGYIRVSPPKGQCFIIQRRREEPDSRVCKPTSLSFTLGDLEPDGQLHWQIITGPADFGTPISWPSPYRIGRAVDENKPWPGPSQPVFIKKCSAMSDPVTGRRIHLLLFHGQRWTITFPAVDQLAPQPSEPPPQLYIYSEDKSSGLNKLASPRGEGGEAGPSTAKAEAKASSDNSPKTVLPEDRAGINTLLSIVSPWQMHPRGAYTMNGSHFLGAASLPPAMRKSECRYKYQEDPQLPYSGRIECQGVGGYKWLSLPLTCLKKLQPLLIFAALGVAGLSPRALAADPTLSPPSEETAKTVLDSSPYSSARGAGMADALSSLADGIHAPYYNPAGIGGLHWDKQKPPSVRLLHFPYLGVAANENATRLRNEFTSQSGQNSAAAQAMIDAEAGKRQYLRFSTLLSLVVDRFAFVQFQDTQLASFRRSDATGLADAMATAYRNQVGSGLGFSVTNPKETIYLGAFTAVINRKELHGDYAFSDLVDRQARNSLIAANAHNYQGQATYVGFIWQLGSYGRPSLSLVSRDIGSTLYHLQGASPDPTLVPTLVKEEEDLTLGFSYSPKIGKSSYFNFIMEGHHLTQKELALSKKFRSACEFNFGGFGSEASLGLRMGLDFAGVSGGLSLNLGLLQLELASLAKDIGIANYRVIERRNMAILAVNVLDQ